jgi:RNA recognition motif-containing protein
LINLSVRGLSSSTTEQSLHKLFSEFGMVHSLTIVRDMFTGKCRGFASVKMEGHEAKLAIANLNNREFDGSVIRVEKQKPRFSTVKKRR